MRNPKQDRQDISMAQKEITLKLEELYLGQFEKVSNFSVLLSMVFMRES